MESSYTITLSGTELNITLTALQTDAEQWRKMACSRKYGGDNYVFFRSECRKRADMLDNLRKRLDEERTLHPITIK
jgi:hypothetical protein